MRGAITIAAVLAGLVLLPIIAFASRQQQQTAPSQPI